MKPAFWTRLPAAAAIILASFCQVRAERPSDSSAVTAAATLDAADWPTYNHDVLGWRYNPAEKTLSPANVGKLVEKWRFPPANSKDVIGAVQATPAVVGGEVYFGTATFPAFYKLDRNGRQLWVYRNPVSKPVMFPTSEGVLGDKLGSAIREGGILSSALVVNGAVYFADTGGWIYCLDAATGAERWKLDTRSSSFPNAHPNNLTLCSPINADGKIVIGGGTLEQLYAGTKAYPGSTGRGFMIALNPKTGELLWKYDVGEQPQRLDPPVVVKDAWGEYTFTHGPGTSSVWSTPSYDADSGSIFFGTDVNTAPRQPTPDNSKLFTEDSDAIVCLDVRTGKRNWSTQLYPGDQWVNAMRAWDPKTGLYKDCSIGDTPKIFSIDLDGKRTKVVGAGCKNGGFYILRADDGTLVRHTPIYAGPPTEPPAPHDPRVLALPSPIGGLQTGCATDGLAIFTNGIDAVRLTTQEARFAAGQIPTGGRVTATSIDLDSEIWRHERAMVPATAGTPDKPILYQRGDIVGSGIAVGNGVAYFTAAGSCQLVALATASGSVLREIEMGPVFCGPALSRGRVYVGGGNVIWSAPGARNKRAPAAAKPALSTAVESGGLFPLQIVGSVRCFGLPDAADTSLAQADSGPTPATPTSNSDAPRAADEVERRDVKIFSDGTRMAGHLYLPKSRKPEDALPAIVICNGTGGVKEGVGARLGPILAQHGYAALAFDYRGWGASESQLMAVEPQPKPDANNEMTIKVRALRGQMNYTDQTEDIRAAISFMSGEPGVDPQRIGLWGTSYGGGLVTWVAAGDPRVKCVVAQVPGMGGVPPRLLEYAYSTATKQARGATESVPVETGKLTGALARYKQMRWNPTKNLGFSAMEAAGKIKVPMLFVVAEKEELTNNTVVKRVHEELVKRGVSSTWHVLKGVTHYGVYNEGFAEATRVELQWFDAHLKK